MSSKQLLLYSPLLLLPLQCNCSCNKLFSIFIYIASLQLPQRITRQHNNSSSTSCSCCSKATASTTSTALTASKSSSLSTLSSIDQKPSVEQIASTVLESQIEPDTETQNQIPQQQQQKQQQQQQEEEQSDHQVFYFVLQTSKTVSKTTTAAVEGGSKSKPKTLITFSSFPSQTSSLGNYASPSLSAFCLWVLVSTHSSTTRNPVARTGPLSKELADHHQQSQEEDDLHSQQQKRPLHQLGRLSRAILNYIRLDDVVYNKTSLRLNHLRESLLVVTWPVFKLPTLLKPLLRNSEFLL